MGFNMHTFTEKDFINLGPDVLEREKIAHRANEINKEHYEKAHHGCQHNTTEPYIDGTYACYDCNHLLRVKEWEIIKKV